MSDVTGVAATGGVASTTSKTEKKADTTAKDFKETLKKVEGHRFAQITDGERKGLYINQSGNARDGEAFKLVERDGRAFHVYGTGADRQVFEVKMATKATAQDSSRS